MTNEPIYIAPRQLLRELHCAGYNDTVISKSAGVPVSTIWRLRQGLTKTPGLDLYFAIFRLWKKACDDDAGEKL